MPAGETRHEQRRGSPASGPPSSRASHHVAATAPMPNSAISPVTATGSAPGEERRRREQVVVDGAVVEGADRRLRAQQRDLAVDRRGPAGRACRCPGRRPSAPRWSRPGRRRIAARARIARSRASLEPTAARSVPGAAPVRRCEVAGSVTCARPVTRRRPTPAARSGPSRCGCGTRPAAGSRSGRPRSEVRDPGDVDRVVALVHPRGLEDSNDVARGPDA